MDGISLSRLGRSSFRLKFADRVDDSALALCRGLLQSLEEAELPGLLDITPAYGEVLLEFSPESSDASGLIRDALKKARPLPADEARLHEIPVVYDGPDLEELAKLKNLSPAEVIEIHSAPIYTVYQIGFSPGFPYLGPLDERLHTPRLSSPRSRIEPGSIAIGGEHTGIYSIRSAGGWRLIGRTSVEIFSPEKGRGDGEESAFLVRQGDRVKFVPQP